MSDAAGSRVVAVLATAPSTEVAEQIGGTLVEERLAACVNLVPGMVSIFRWRGAVSRESEVLMILKTTTDAVESLKRRIVDLHPYEVPEVLALEVRDGLPAYLDWVRAEVGRAPDG